MTFDEWYTQERGHRPEFVIDAYRYDEDEELSRRAWKAATRESEELIKELRETLADLQRPRWGNGWED